MEDKTEKVNVGHTLGKFSRAVFEVFSKHGLKVPENGYITGSVAEGSRHPGDLDVTLPVSQKVDERKARDIEEEVRKIAGRGVDFYFTSDPAEIRELKRGIDPNSTSGIAWPFRLQDK